MAAIQVDRHVIIPAGGQSSGVNVLPVEGKPLVMLEMLHDGVRIRALLTPQEAMQLGVGLTQGAALAAYGRPPTGPIVRGPSGEPVELGDNCSRRAIPANFAANGEPSGAQKPE